MKEMGLQVDGKKLFSQYFAHDQIVIKKKKKFLNIW